MHHGYRAVVLEEWGVQPGEIVGLQKSVFQDKQGHRDGPANVVEVVQLHPYAQGQEGAAGEEMHPSGDVESTGDPEPSGHGIHAVFTVKLIVATGIQDVKPTSPGGHGKREERRLESHLAGDADPCAGGSDGETPAQQEITAPGVILGKGVEDHVRRRHRSQGQRQAV